MDVSFILSSDELFTLISLMPEQTEAGRRFADNALSEAVLCDLTGLEEKKLARISKEGVELEPVIHMLADAMARADSAELHGDIWEIHSSWVSLQCIRYKYRQGHWKVTPVRGPNT